MSWAGAEVVLPWWGWVLVWLVLLAGGAVWVGVLSRRVWGKTKLLAAEVQRAGAMVAELEARADELRVLDDPFPAVLRHPGEVRAERRALRREQRAARRERRAERLPPWARVH